MQELTDQTGRAASRTSSEGRLWGGGDPWRGIYLNQDLNEEELTLQKALGQSVLGRRKSKCNPPPPGEVGGCAWLIKRKGGCRKQWRQG